MAVAAGLATILAGGALNTASGVAAGPADYGPGVALLERWYKAEPRGDLVGDTALVDAATDKARNRIEAPRISLDGTAVVAFAVATPSGAVAYVVQYATDTRDGQTTIVQGVSLPVGVGVWFDSDGTILAADTWFPVSQGESATFPEDAGLVSGMWTSDTQRHLVLFDTAYPTHLRDGVLGPKYSRRSDLVRSSERRVVDFGTAGYSLVTPSEKVLRDTAIVSFKQPEGLVNFPILEGSSLGFTWAHSFPHHEPLSLYFEGHQSSGPLRIRPWEPAYTSGREASRLARTWTNQRVSLNVRLDGSPLQARLAGGERVLVRNVVWGKAYVALVKFRSGNVVGVRCKTPGAVLTASCRLPRHLGRVFVVDEPFWWKVGGHTWTRAGEADYDTRAAIVPPGATIRVEPRRGDPFVLYR